MSQDVENTDMNMSRFLAWFEQGGGVSYAAEIKSQGVHRGLYSTKDIRKGEPILSVPLTLCFFNNDWELEALKKLLGPADNLPYYMTSVLRLLLEMKHPCSKWRPYLDVLPAENITPVSNLNKLQQNVLQKTAAWPDLYEDIRDYFIEWKHVSQLNNLFSNLVEEDYFWARMTHVRRTFGGESYGWEDRDLLIPFMDMCNHANDSSVYLGFDPKYNHFMAYARKDIQAREELSFYYNSKSNAGFLVQYGFTHPENPSKLALLPYGKLVEASVSENLITAEIIDRCTMIYSDEVDSLKTLLSRLRYWFDKGVSSLNDDPVNYLEPISINNEVMTHRAIIEICIMRLSSLPTDNYRQIRNDKGKVSLKAVSKFEREIDFHEFNLQNIIEDELVVLDQLKSLSSQFLTCLASRDRNVEFQEYSEEDSYFAEHYRELLDLCWALNDGESSLEGSVKGVSGDPVINHEEALGSTFAIEAMSIG